MSTPQVTILIPNYKTPQLTKLCLRLIRRNTDLEYGKVLVIDNNSADESLEYVRALRWIQLLERPDEPREAAPLSHSRALDLGLEHVDTPYVLSIHTDTLVRHPQWLSFLVAQIERHPHIAAVGSWNLPEKWSIKQIEKWLEYYGLSHCYGLFNQAKYKLTGQQDYYYLRSHCALYKTALLRKYGLSFSDEGKTAGQVMHRKLLQHGHRMVFLPPQKLLRYLEHINHATVTLHPQIRARKSRRKDEKRLEKTWKRFDAEKILADTSLNQ